MNKMQALAKKDSKYAAICYKIAYYAHQLQTLIEPFFGAYVVVEYHCSKILLDRRT